MASYVAFKLFFRYTRWYLTHGYFLCLVVEDYTLEILSDKFESLQQLSSYGRAV